MQATELLQVISRLRAGQCDVSDGVALEQATADEFLLELADYPFVFQERRLNAKWEVGRARIVSLETVVFRRPESRFPMVLMLPCLRDCLFISGEGSAITGLSAVTKILLRPIHKPAHALALSTSRGFKFDQTIDGWILKPLTKRTVKLTDDFLQQRGWKFDVLDQIPGFAVRGRTK